MTREDAAYCILGHEARTQKRGLWELPLGERIAPWEWRRRKRLDHFTDYSQETVANCIGAISAR